MKLKTIIVDDSTMQRMAISKLVSKHPQLNLIAEYSNAIEARNALKNYEIDLIFLDIEMPIINGFDLLEALDNPPQVVLITGKTDYALKAFDYDVTDYLHKPITRHVLTLLFEELLPEFKATPSTKKMKSTSLSKAT